jgi:DoxX-like family
MTGRMNGPARGLQGTGIINSGESFSRHGTRTIAYWIFTVFVVFENAAGFVWAILHIDYLRVMLTHLGYPQYFVNILGPWQLACAAALIAPRFPLVKEWAYAGAFFNYSSAVISHMFVGDGPDRWSAALLFAMFTVCSWALRPPDRRLARPTPVSELGVLSWVVPILVLLVMFVVALFTLPQPAQF